MKLRPAIGTYITGKRFGFEFKNGEFSIMIWKWIFTWKLKENKNGTRPTKGVVQEEVEGKQEG